jgi:hypothetical protein
MLSPVQTPTIRLGNLFPRHEVYAKWESNWSRLPAGAATFCALRPTSPRNAGAISSIPTWTRTGPRLPIHRSRGATRPSHLPFVRISGGGGGLLMGLLAYLRNHPAPVTLFGCEPYNYPKYARFDHARSTTIADGLILETPHPQVQKAIADGGVTISLVPEADIRAALKDLFEAQAVVVEPSSAITLAFVKTSIEMNTFLLNV